MTRFGRVAITGPTGRLGRAVVRALQDANRDVISWGRPDYDLDRPGVADGVLSRDRPELVIHTAAWTDVDGCTREPELANRRNAAAVAELATACAGQGASLLLISTNEVFDGKRTDHGGYGEDDAVSPINAYGRSKLEGERQARAAFMASDASLWIVRTAWLFGPPGGDFPMKILAASERLGPDQPLRVVVDEVGSPTFTSDLAAAVLRLVDRGPSATYHLAGGGLVSRADWAARVLGLSGVTRRIEPITQSEYERLSHPPKWGVLDTSKAASVGVALAPWTDALERYLADVSAPR